MPKSANQKLKLLYILDYLKTHTDEEHGVTMTEIIAMLVGNGITAERKSIYGDLDLLRNYGYDIIGQQEKSNFTYKLVSREFELAELKILVDAVQYAKSITEKKSNELIHKLEGLVSKNDAKMLQQQVFLNGRVKTMNESIYYNVDEIHQAIHQNMQIKFRYYEWKTDKTMQLKRNGEYYVVSPWGLLQDDENYYLLAFDEAEDRMKHFRIDKMINISQLKESRVGKEQMQSINFASYPKQIFGMFGGKTTTVKLRCKDELIGVIIDRFGKEVTIIKVNEGYFDVIVEVVASKQFFAWIIALGEGIELISPETALQAMQDEIKRLVRQYRI